MCIQYRKREKMTELEGVDILRAIDLANLVRNVGGFDPLDDLVPGIPNDSENCVLANTFNCSCLVGAPSGSSRYDDGSYAWHVGFEEEKYADALALELGEQVASEYSGNDYGESNNIPLFSVKLPQLVGEIAAKFDHGDLDSKYYDGDEDFVS